MEASQITLSSTEKKTSLDTVTPHKIAVVLLIEEWSVHRGSTLKEDSMMEPYSECEERNLMFTLLNILQSSDQDLKDLFNKLKVVLKQKHLVHYIERLRKLFIGGVHNIMDLMQDLTTVLFDDEVSLLHRSSILGLYIRRMILSFDKLTFNHITLLHQQCTLHYNKAASYICSQMAHNDSMGFDDTSLSMSELMTNYQKPESGKPQPSRIRFADEREPVEEETEQSQYSHRQAELFIAQQVSLLQYNQLEALEPNELQDKLSELLSSNPGLAEAHFLSYMNCLRVGEYCGAVDNLYSYFDQHTIHIASPVNITSPNGTPNNQQDTVTQGKGYRYAALNLAMLHYKFGHYKEARAAVHESIRMAQDANDHICLQHALSWLYRVGVASGGDFPVESSYLLERLVATASVLKMAYVGSLSLQVYAKHSSLVSSMSPSYVFSCLMKGDEINCQHFLSTLMSSSFVQKSALWHYYGNMEMCNLNSQVLLNLSTADLGVYHNNESECIALCHLAALHSQQGKYKACRLIMGEAKRRFPARSTHDKIWMIQEQKLLFERYLISDQFMLAQLTIDNIHILDEVAAKVCQIRLMKERGDLKDAFVLAEDFIANCKTKDTSTRTQLCDSVRILLSEIHCCFGEVTRATDPLFVAIRNAQSAHRNYIVTMAKIQLAFVQFYMGIPHQALSLLDSVLVSVLAHGSLYECARAQYLRVRCKVAVAGKNNQGNLQSVITSVLPQMKEVVKMFKKAEAYQRMKDATYYMAILYDQLGCRDQRNKCSLEFRKLSEDYPTWGRHDVVL